MEVVRKLKELLHDLLLGDKSPVNLEVTREIIDIVRESEMEVGQKYYIELQLSDVLAETFYQNFDNYKAKNNSPDIKNFYKIIKEEKYAFTEEEYQNEKEEWDLAKEKNLKEVPLYLAERKDQIFSSLLKERKIHFYDVYIHKAELSGSTYKVDFITSKKLISTLTFYEVQYKYYQLFVPAEFHKLKYELTKSNELKDTITEAINFYMVKFSNEAANLVDKKLSLCYDFVVKELDALLKFIQDFFSPLKETPKNIDILVWTKDFEHFIDFFNPLINEGIIEYKGGNVKYSIYYILLQHIQIKESDKILSINEFFSKLNNKSVSEVKEIEIIKLDFTPFGVEPFYEIFKKLINNYDPEKSILRINDAAPITPIVKILAKIFTVNKYYYPHTPIDDETLAQQFRVRFKKEHKKTDKSELEMN